MNWNIGGRWLAKAVSPGGTRIVRSAGRPVRAGARKCRADKPNRQEILVRSQSERDAVPRFFETSCWELNSRCCFIEQTVNVLLPLVPRPSVTRVRSLPFCRCRCSRQYHRCTCACLYLRVQESHVIVKNTKKIYKKYTKNIFFRPEFSTGINEYFS